jgi:kynurenine formamidase
MTDAATIDFIRATTRPNHHRLLGAGIPIVEFLKNLSLLPEKKPFLISALPLKLFGRDGAPCRAVAFPDVAGFGEG